MAALSQPTYALLQPPSFDVLPNTDIHLGTVFPRTKSRPRRADTHRILNRSSRIPIPSTLYCTRNDPTVLLDAQSQKSEGAGITLHLPLLQGLGGGISGSHEKAQLLYIRAKNVQTEWFIPDDSYFAQSLKGVAVKKELLGFRNPSVFMVTGLKIAEAATIITGQKKGEAGELGPEIDLTPLGVPVEVGASINAKRAEYTIVPIEKTKFVLAFETRRIRVKKNGYTEEDFNNFAVLDDEAEDPKTLSEGLHEMLSMHETVTEVDDDE